MEEITNKKIKIPIGLFMRPIATKSKNHEGWIKNIRPLFLLSYNAGEVMYDA
jgi:hypothetical protein